MALVGTGAAILGAAPVAISHMISTRAEKPESPAADRWADDQFTSSPALDASSLAQDKLVKQAKVELERLSSEEVKRGPGECKTGDRIELLGGWVSGSAGINLLTTPVGDLKSVINGNADERSFFITNFPLLYDWKRGCKGIGYIGPREAILYDTSGKAEFEGGEFLLAATDAGFLGYPSHACYLVVPSSEVTCAKE